MRLYYAQNKEDLLIKSFFPDIKEGFYIDIGANDPVIDSVTKLFYDEGWRGINIEPIKRHFDNICSHRLRDINLNIGVSNKKGVLEFTEYPEGDGLSTFDKTMRDYYKKADHPFPTQKMNNYKVSVTTLADIIKQHGDQKINFLKIDVEGFEYEVIEGNDWKVFRPELICIEANHISHDWRPILTRNDYEQVFFDGINNYYLAKESLYRKDYFDYPNAVFAGNPVYFPAVKEIEGPLKNKVDQLTVSLQDKEQELSQYQRQQRDVRFLGKRLLGELQVRLHNRAHSVAQLDSHFYSQDDSIKEKLTDSTVSGDDLLAFIKARDTVNISRRKTILRDKAKPYFWKIVAKIFSLGMRVTKKIAAKA